MIQGNLALKLKDFEGNYCHPYIVDSVKQNLPDNIIQFPKVIAEDAAGNKASKSITLKLIAGKRK